MLEDNQKVGVVVSVAIRTVQAAVSIFLGMVLALVFASPASAQGTGADEPVPRCGGRAATIVGTVGPDTLQGTDGDDVIVAFGGADRVYAGAGNDLICGGGGADQLFGGPGNDRIWGGNGPDRLLGGPGNDVLLSGAGNDTSLGHAGNDTFRGGAGGRDVCLGGQGFNKEASCESRGQVRPINLVGSSNNNFVQRAIFLTNEDRRAAGQQRLWRGFLHHNAAEVALDRVLAEGLLEEGIGSAVVNVPLADIAPVLAEGRDESVFVARVCGVQRPGIATNQLLDQIRQADELAGNVLITPSFDRIGAASRLVFGCTFAALYAGGPLPIS